MVEWSNSELSARLHMQLLGGGNVCSSYKDAELPDSEFGCQSLIHSNTQHLIIRSTH